MSLWLSVGCLTKVLTSPSKNGEDDKSRGNRERVSIQLSDGRTTPTLPADLRPIFLVEAADNSIVLSQISFTIVDDHLRPHSLICCEGNIKCLLFVIKLLLKCAFLCYGGKGCMIQEEFRTNLSTKSDDFFSIEYTVSFSSNQYIHFYNFLQDSSEVPIDVGK